MTAEQGFPNTYPPPPEVDSLNSSRNYDAEVRSSREHCAHCFDVLLAHFDGQQEPPKPSFDNAVCPLFITWKKVSSRQPQDQYKLRGCIGTLEPKHLTTAVTEYAIVSSLRDRRFMPISSEEIELLKCTVSLLTNFERMASWQDWQLGLHGLVVEFQNPATLATSTATFLPDVPRLERWGQRQTIDSLIRKAGFAGPIDEGMRQAVRLTRYQASATSLTYQEYLQLRGSEHATLEDATFNSCSFGSSNSNSTILGDSNHLDAPGIVLKSGSPPAVPFGEVVHTAPVLNG